MNIVEFKFNTHVDIQNKDEVSVKILKFKYNNEYLNNVQQGAKLNRINSKSSMVVPVYNANAKRFFDINIDAKIENDKLVLVKTNLDDPSIDYDVVAQIEL